METAIIGLLGAVVGGLITLLVALINNRKELALKEKEFQLKSRELEIANRTRNREEKLSKYSKFLGAFQLVLGYLGEIIDIIQQERTLEKRDKLVSEIVDHPHYEEAIKNLNEGCGWINILSDTSEITDRIFELQEKFDIFVPFLATLRNKQEISDERSELYKELDDLKEIYKSIVKLMQSELKIPNN
ncbi:MAG: hypothetical protein M0P73_02635 [Syntrophobacterales bacterium]|nr:hypothetical protein [Syntrophobacterales bacterium]